MDAGGQGLAGAGLPTSPSEDLMGWGQTEAVRPSTLSTGCRDGTLASRFPGFDFTGIGYR